MEYVPDNLDDLEMREAERSRMKRRKERLEADKSTINEKEKEE